MKIKGLWMTCEMWLLITAVSFVDLRLATNLQNHQERNGSSDCRLYLARFYLLVFGRTLGVCHALRLFVGGVI